jgi:hypothetical protein
MTIEESVVCQAGIVSAAQMQPLASVTAAHINGQAKMNSNSTMQQADVIIENKPAAVRHPRAAAPQRAFVANPISPPAVTAAAGVSARCTGNGLTRQEQETALHVLASLSKHKEAQPFRAPVDWEALVRVAALQFNCWVG